MAPTTFVLVTLAWQFGSGVAEAQHGGCEAREPSQSCMTATLAHDMPHDDAAQMKTSLLQNGLHQDRDEIGVHEQKVGKIRNKEAQEAEWGWAKNKINNVKDKVKDKFEDVKDKVTDVKETVKNGIGQAKDVWSELKDKWLKLKGIVKKEKDKIDDLVKLDGIFEAHLMTALHAIQGKGSLLQDGEVGNAQNTEAQETEWGWARNKFNDAKNKFNDAKKVWTEVKEKVDVVKDIAKTLMEHKETFDTVIEAASGLAR